MKITAIVVTYNEERRLEACLRSLEFCSQILLMDIGSSDRSAEIAESCGVKVYHHSWVPVVEELWPQMVSMAENDWILRIDPDEAIPPALGRDILEAIEHCDENVGLFYLPHQYYFIGKPIRTSAWGGIKYLPKVFHRDRVSLTGLVHLGIKCKDGFIWKELPYNGNNALQHYWIDSYHQLWDKHWRYIKLEGKSRYGNGERFSLFYLFWETARAFYDSAFRRRGWRGGYTGIFLTIFYTWYIFMGCLSLALFQFRRFRSMHGMKSPMV